MPLYQLVLILIVVGVLLYLINMYVPMQATIKMILNAVVIIAVILFVLSAFGVLDSFMDIRLGDRTIGTLFS
ncbi:MAG: Thivi_2564 family membrane protein [Sphaerochaeta sp.]